MNLVCHVGASHNAQARPDSCYDIREDEQRQYETGNQGTGYRRT